MATHKVTLKAVTSDVMATFVTKMQIFIKINKTLKEIISNFKRSYDKQNLTRVIAAKKLLNSPKARLINSI